MMCQRTVWLDHGQVRQAGPTAEVVRAYLDAVDETLLADAALTGDEDDLVREVATLDRDGALRTDFAFGEPLRVRVDCSTPRELRNVSCTVTVRGDYGPLFSATSEPASLWAAGAHELACTFDNLPLLPGLYRIDVLLRHADTPPWTLPKTGAAFRVDSDLAEFGSDSVVGATKSRGGFLAVAYDWRVQSLEGEQRLPGLRLPRRNMAPE
jgi:hypothetical protein